MKLEELSDSSSSRIEEYKANLNSAEETMRKQNNEIVELKAKYAKVITELVSAIEIKNKEIERLNGMLQSTNLTLEQKVAEMRQFKEIIADAFSRVKL